MSVRRERCPRGGACNQGATHDITGPQFRECLEVASRVADHTTRRALARGAVPPPAAEPAPTADTWWNKDCDITVREAPDEVTGIIGRASQPSAGMKRGEDGEGAFYVLPPHGDSPAVEGEIVLDEKGKPWAVLDGGERHRLSDYLKARSDPQSPKSAALVPDEASEQEAAQLRQGLAVLGRYADLKAGRDYLSKNARRLVNAES